MPDLLLENVPQELFDRIQKMAMENQQSIEKEALDWLAQSYAPGSGFLGCIPAPCTIPFTGEGKRVRAVRRTEPRLPDPPWFISGPSCPVCEEANNNRKDS